VPVCGQVRHLQLPDAETQASFLRRRTSDRLDAWESCGASTTVLSWLRDGYTLPFASPVQPFNQGVSLTRLAPDARAFIMKELQRCFNTGALEPATCSDYITKAFLVPKAGSPGKYRLVLDFRWLNSHLHHLSCRYETLKVLRDVLETNDYMFSLDISDGFHCVPIAERDRKFLTFNIEGVGLIQCAALPFGLTCSPYVFTKCMRVLVEAVRSPMRAMERGEEARLKRQALLPQAAPPHAHGSAYLPPHRRAAQQPPPPRPPGAARPALRDLLRRHRETMRRGVRVLPYVDDFLFMCRTLLGALRARDYVDDLLDLLGLARSLTKGVRDPCQQLIHLGLGVNSAAMVYFLPEARRVKIATAAREILSQSSGSNSLISERRLRGFCGLAQSVYLAVPPVPLFLRSLYDTLAGDHPSGKVRLGHQARRDLNWFANIPDKWEQRPIQRRPETAVVWTDASKSGWGGVAEVNGERYEAKGFWQPHERLLHINVLEMRAKWLVTLSCASVLHHRHVRYWGDNTAVTAVATKWASRSPVLMDETRMLFQVLDSLDASNAEFWLSTHLNVDADRLSREDDRSDWQLHPGVFRDLDARWGPHTVDRFATENNAQLARFNSAWCQPSSEGVDAFAQTNWATERNWCNPPWALLPRLVQLLRATGAAATVIAPDWPAQAWYQQLTEMASTTLRYDAQPDLFLPGSSSQPVGAARWGVVAFKVPARRRR